MKGGYWCGVGIERPKTKINLGTLWRSAVCLGADFIFTVGHRYEKEASDTIYSPSHIPCFHYKDLEDFNTHRPFDAQLVGVELSNIAQPLETYVHPKRAIYLLGPEDGSLSHQAQDLCQDIIAFDSRQCLNVSVAGAVVLYDRRVKAGVKQKPLVKIGKK